MAKISLDVDGVLANFNKGFVEQINHIWPGRLAKDHIQKHWHDWGDLTDSEIDQVWRRIEATPNWWMTLDAYSSGVGALAIFFWTNQAHDVWLVTSRSDTLGHSTPFQTDTWIRACGVNPCQNFLSVITATYPSDKRGIYKHIGIEYSLDDKGDTVMQCDKLEGHKAFLLDQPWNQQAVVKRRVKSVQEYLDAITKA
jgi:uncharacterized HAD superfamily protein